jgi:hypothetical protein
VLGFEDLNLLACRIESLSELSHEWKGRADDQDVNDRHGWLRLALCDVLFKTDLLLINEDCSQ